MELMAVEARQISLFPSQILSNREVMINGGVEGIGNGHGAPLVYGMVAPLSGTTTATDMVVPMYGSAMMGNAPAKTVAVKSDSGVTYAVPASRKRSRDAISNPLVSSFQSGIHNQISNNRCGSFTFLGEDFSFHFLQQQLEMDRFIAQHTEKMRRETEERRKRFSRRIAATVEESIMKNLRAKEEEIDKIGKLNLALEERVKSLCVENQIWRDLAQTNEATANTLRCNLEQVLAQIHQDEQKQIHQHPGGCDATFADDTESCCGSNFNDKSDDVEEHNGNIGRSSRMCRKCGKEESCVLLLPCRHLCLCTVCGSSLHTCPVCNCSKTASVHVNLSSS